MAASSDDEFISPSRRHISALKRQIIEESDGESEECNGPRTATCTSRQSTRIKKRQSREFHMPDKHVYREQMHPYKRGVAPLSPRKLVNNLTKVNNRYNADTYDTDEEDLSDFIVYDDEIQDETDSSSTSEVDKPIFKGRIDRTKTESSASKRQRLREISSSDSENDTKSTNEKSTFDSCKEKDQNGYSIHKTDRSPTPLSQNGSENFPKNTTKEPESLLDEGTQSDSNDSVLNISSANKTRKIISSDSDSDSGDSDDSNGSCEKSATSRIAQQNRHRQELFKDLKESRKKSR